VKETYFLASGFNETALSVGLQMETEIVTAANSVSSDSHLSFSFYHHHHHPRALLILLTCFKWSSRRHVILRNLIIAELLL
jgi:hypothetical protein